MIKASELRIGNLMQDKYSNQIIKVICLEENKIHFSGYFPDKWQAEPIILSEEILLKVWFELSDDTWVNNHGFTLGIKIKSKIPYFMTSGTLIEIKYLHQLQNLYFALTGQELNTDKLLK